MDRLVGELDQLGEVKAQPTFSGGLLIQQSLAHASQQLAGAPGMSRYTGSISFSHLHAGSGEFDECFEKVGDRAGASGGVPEGFPNFMSFPVIAVLEEFDPSKIFG